MELSRVTPAYVNMLAHTDLQVDLDQRPAMLGISGVVLTEVALHQ
jgi:hypothetical protein